MLHKTLIIKIRMATLIKDEAELKAVLGGVQQNITWETFAPFVKQAEIEFIVPAISEDFYDELCNIDNPDIVQTKLIERLKIASGYYALSIALPQLVTVVGDAGAMASNQGGAPMAKWLYLELRNGAISKADKTLEETLVWLEKNAGSFETWTDSEVYTISKSLYINSATDLTVYFPQAQNSRRLYLQLRNYLKRVEDFYLKPVLGDAFFSALKVTTDGDSNELKLKKAEALKLAKYFLANKAMAEALPYLNINENFYLVSSASSTNVQSEELLDQPRRDGIKLDCDSNANLFLNKLRGYLDKYASETIFAEYFTSEQYTVLQANKPHVRKKNEPVKSYVVF